MKKNQMRKYITAFALGTAVWMAGAMCTWADQGTQAAGAPGTWVLDESGGFCHTDENGQLQHSAWIEEGGRWKYVDEEGHMVLSATKTIDGIQYTFGADGFWLEGKERQAVELELGRIEGKTYRNRWADIRMTFPEAAVMKLGDGSKRTYPLAGGEHVEEDDPELSYRITLDFLQPETDMDTYLGQFAAEQGKYEYKMDFAGPISIGGYEYKACRTSLAFSDGTAHHSDKYVRMLDGVMLELHFDYFDELRAQADSVFASISPAE